MAADIAKDLAIACFVDNGKIALRATKAGAKRWTSKFINLRGRATVRMTTEEILALTRSN
jgi:hypothetical protein